MGKRFVVAMAGAALAGATLIGVGDASAAKPPVTAQGSVQCTVAGKVKYNPPLDTTMTPTTTTITAKLTCSTGQTGTAGLVRGGKLAATSTSVQSSCSHANIAEANGTIRWTAAGGRLVPTTANLGAGADLTGIRMTSPGIDTGSYTSQPLEINGSLTTPPCTKSIKKAVLNGTLDIGSTCAANILTGHSILPDSQDDTLWFVVGSFCDYLPANHPTGTITWAHPNQASPLCSGSGPIVDSGSVYAFTPWNPPAPKSYTYWGVDTGLTIAELNTGMCGFKSPRVTYSGDSRYRPYDQPASP
jgi:hypothetical protein